jgi:hypothetical protein
MRGDGDIPVQAHFESRATGACAGILVEVEIVLPASGEP